MESSHILSVNIAKKKWWGLKREDQQTVQKYMEKDPGRIRDGDEAVSEPL